MTTTLDEGQLPEQVDRRSFLRKSGRVLGGAAVLGVGGPALLEACSSSKSSTSSGGATTTAGAAAAGTPSTVAPGTYGTLSFVLPWIKNVESAGEFIADSSGIYLQQGFGSVNLIASGPNAPPQETMIKTGQGLIGITSLDSTAAAIQKGLNLVCIGTEYQKNPFCIMSAATKPHQHAPGHDRQEDRRAVAQRRRVGRLPAGQQHRRVEGTKVTVGFDPTPITQGTVDGWFSFITNEPIELGAQGLQDGRYFLLNDYNYPEVGNAFICTTDSLKTARAKVKAAHDRRDPRAGRRRSPTRRGVAAGRPEGTGPRP